MTPNWTKLEALLRTLTILFAATFFGAVILPVAADGSIPMTWAAWRPVLATALGASVAAEFVWLRSHLSQAASAAGLTPPTAGQVAAAAAAKVAPLACLVLLLGCPAAAQPVANLAACIASDALNGDPIAQIATDCGSDVPAVLIALLDSKDPAVTGSKAYAEAQRVQTQMMSRGALGAPGGAAPGGGK